MTVKKDYNPIEVIHNFDLCLQTRTVFLHAQEYGVDGEEGGIDWKVATKFIKNIYHLNSLNNKPIKVIISSFGGDYYFGMSIYDTIKNSVAPIDIYAYGCVASMTTIILQAAKTRYLSQHSSFMIHMGDYQNNGDLRKVTSGIDFYKTHNKEMFDIYAERCVDGEFFKRGNMSKENVADYLESEVKDKVDFWLTAEEAVNMGFVDAII